MQAIVTVALPVFALIACGYAALRFRALDRSAVDGLNAFVYHFALPALLLKAMAGAPVEALFDGRFFIAYYGAGALLFITTFALSMLAFRTSTGVATIQSLCAVWANSGYLGIPLLLTGFGEQAAIVAVLVLTFDSIVLLPLAIALLAGNPGEQGGLAKALRNAGWNLVTNPLILAIFLGLVLAVARLPIPAPLFTFIDFLGSAAGPCALFALGASLVGVPVSDARGEVALLTGLKLLIHPALVHIACQMIDLSMPTTLMATLVAALPTGASVFVLASRYETYPRRASTVVLVSHVLAVLTVSLLLVFVMPARGQLN
ncbi:MAG: AEC family transporter [Geminicoccaceae bacterium]